MSDRPPLTFEGNTEFEYVVTLTAAIDDKEWSERMNEFLFGDEGSGWWSYKRKYRRGTLEEYIFYFSDEETAFRFKIRFG